MIIVEENNKEMIWSIIVTIFIFVFAFIVIWFCCLMADMWHDHECYVDGHYDTPQCQKYIQEDR